MRPFEFTRPPVAAELHVDFGHIESHVQERRRAVEEAATPAARHVVASVLHGLPTNAAEAALVHALEQALWATLDFGFEQAQAEIARMRGETIKFALEFGQRPRLPRTLDGARRLVRERASFIARRVAEAARSGVGEQVGALERARRILHNCVLEAVGETLNIGRHAGALNYGTASDPNSPFALADPSPMGPPQFAMRSEQLDKATCSACHQLHGEIVVVDSPSYYEFMPPAGCYGGGRCRGVYVFADGVSDISGPKGPPTGPVDLPAKPPPLVLPKPAAQPGWTPGIHFQPEVGVAPPPGVLVNGDPFSNLSAAEVKAAATKVSNQIAGLKFRIANPGPTVSAEKLGAMQKQLAEHMTRQYLLKVSLVKKGVLKAIPEPPNEFLKFTPDELAKMKYSAGNKLSGLRTRLQKELGLEKPPAQYADADLDALAAAKGPKATDLLSKWRDAAQEKASLEEAIAKHPLLHGKAPKVAKAEKAAPAEKAPRPAANPELAAKQAEKETADRALADAQAHLEQAKADAVRPVPDAELVGDQAEAAELRRLFAEHAAARQAGNGGAVPGINQRIKHQLDVIAARRATPLDGARAKAAVVRRLADELPDLEGGRSATASLKYLDQDIGRLAEERAAAARAAVDALKTKVAALERDIDRILNPPPEPPPRSARNLAPPSLRRDANGKAKLAKSETEMRTKLRKAWTEPTDRGPMPTDAYSKAAAAKDEVMRKLGRRLRGDTGFVDFARKWATDPSFRQRYGWMGTLQRYGAADDVEAAVSNMIQTWAGTSDSNNPLSLAMQLAVRDEFDLPASAVKALEGRDAGAMTVAERLYGENRAAFRAFVRAQYDETQAWLADHGITHVYLYRGQGYPGGGESGIRHIDLQPASSFSYTLSTSHRFRRNLSIAARVPAERIIGTARTGWGCHNETELVVLAGDSGADEAGAYFGGITPTDEQLLELLAGALGI